MHITNSKFRNSGENSGDTILHYMVNGTYSVGSIPKPAFFIRSFSTIRFSVEILKISAKGYVSVRSAIFKPMSLPLQSGFIFHLVFG